MVNEKVPLITERITLRKCLVLEGIKKILPNLMEAERNTKELSLRLAKIEAENRNLKSTVKLLMDLSGGKHSTEISTDSGHEGDMEMDSEEGTSRRSSDEAAGLKQVKAPTSEHHQEEAAKIDLM